MVRLAGGWDDLFQYGMAVALPEARVLSPSPGESLDDFAVRLERRVAMAVRHRLIDLIRRQDAADRNTASVSIEEVRERGVEETGNEVDPFDLVFQPHLSRAGSSAARTSPPSSGGGPRGRSSCGRIPAIPPHRGAWPLAGPWVSRRRWQAR